MTPEESDPNREDFGQTDQSLARLQQMYNNLAVINAQVAQQPASEPTEPLKILVVSKDRDFLATVKNFLLLHQMKVMTVVDGLTALTLFHNHSFDAIVTRLSATILDGNIIAQYVRNDVLSVPIIAITDTPTIDDQHFDSVLEMPVKFDALLKEIVHHTSARRLAVKVQ